MRNRKHDIERYLRGELSPSEMHALEKEALSDPFLAEALEGIENAGADNFLYDLHQINRSVHDRMRRRSHKNKTIRVWGWTSAVAATVLLTAVSGFLVVQILKDQQAREESVVSHSDDKKPEATDAARGTTGGDTSLLAMEKPSEIAKPSSESGATARAEDGTRTRETANESETVAAETQRADEKAQRPLAPPDVIADVDQEPVQAVARGDLSAEAHASAADSVDSKIPSDDQALSRALEGKAAGVQARREQPSRARTEDSGLKTVKGKVTSEDGHGLPGVNVVVEGTNRATVTDVEGNYELDVPAHSRLVFGFIGFESRTVLADQPELDITLEEDISTLSEVVVTGSSGDKTTDDPSSFSFAEPDGGKSDFKTYLANTVKYPQEAIKNKIEGKVTVRFTVEPNGKLTDFEVVKGIGSGCEEELIRAIQKGPYWKPSTRGDQPVKDKVRVKFKFNLPD